jgi:hypothetical protein
MWNSIKSMFTGSISGLVDSVGDAIAKNVTSDKERLALQNELKEIASKAQAEGNRHIEAMEAQPTERHANDMKSDSWLSKNVRPMALIFLTLSVVLLAFLTSFKADDLPNLDTWVDLFTGLLMMVYGFYFGSRGLEKVVSILNKDKK